MAVKLTDYEAARKFLSVDVVRNAVMMGRIFSPRRESIVFADDEKRLEALAVIEIPSEPDDTYSMAVQAASTDAARNVIRGIPDGKYWIQLANEDIFPAVRERIKMGWHNASWLLSFGKGATCPEPAHPTGRIEEKWARKIAKVWSSDWDAEDYVKSRLRDGPSAGVFVDDELVAWDLTHFETEAVSMLGFLHVVPEFRGRGYAEAVTCSVLRDVISRGKIPACHIYPENYPSLGLCEGLGFRRVCKQIWGDGVTV